MSITHTILSKNANASAKIAQHIAEFERRGGKIQQIPVGMSAEAYQIEISDKTGKPKWVGLDGTEHMRGKKYSNDRKTFANGNKV